MNQDENLTRQQQRDLDEAIASYLLAAQSGAEPDREGIIARHPDLADHLRSFFEAQNERSSQVAPGEAPTLPASAGAETNRGVKPAPASPANRCGDYELIEEIARGGMGVVSKARQVSLNRIVALKMILAGQLASEQDVQRFYAEAEAAASLDHPGIVPVYEVGEYQGQHYYSMGYVEGQSLADRIADGPLPPRKAAEIVAAIADAIRYAHARGIIHRDLKPGNVLLDKSGQPRITDFGLAKQTERDSQLTGTGQILGTPSYMPPEQAAGRLDEIGPLADVYAIGAILYCLITGRPPFQAASVIDTVRQVLEREPLAPRQLDPNIPRDLDTICLKCLRKEPGKRYPSAQSLAEDLRHFIEDEPIHARPVSQMERAVKWVRRRPLMAAMSAAVAVLLMTVVAGSIIAVVLINEQRLAARNSEQKAKQNEREAKASELRATRAEADKTEKLWQSYLDAARALRWSGQAGRRFKALDALKAAADIRPSLELRNEAIASMALVDVRVARQWEGHPRGTSAIAFDDIFARYARCDDTGSISIRRVVDDQEVINLPGPGEPTWMLAFSRDGRFLAAKHHGAANDNNHRFRLWDLNLRKVVVDRRNCVSNIALDFSPNSQQLAMGHADGSVSLYDTGSGDLQQVLSSAGAQPYHLRYDQTGGRIAVSSLKGVVHIWDLDEKRVARTWTAPSSVRGLAWHPDGTRLAGACSDFQIYVWDAESERLQTTILGHDTETTLLAFNRGGDCLASLGWDGRIRLWDPLTGKQLLSTAGPATLGFPRPQFNNDDQRLAYRTLDTQLQLWEVAPARECRRLHLNLPRGRRFWAVDVSLDGRLLAVARDDGVQLWDVEFSRPVGLLKLGPTSGALFHPDGSLLTLGGAGLLRWPVAESDVNQRPFDARTIGPPQTIPVPGSPKGRVALSQNGRVVAVTDPARGLVAYDLRERKVVVRAALKNHMDVALSPDGRWMASSTFHHPEGMVRVWNLESKRIAVEREGMQFNGTDLRFTPDDAWLIVGGHEKYKFWSTEDWSETRVVPTGPRGGGAARLSAEGTLMAMRPTLGATRLIDPISGLERATIPGHGPWYLSPGGGRLVTSQGTDSLEVWDLRAIRRQLKEMQLDWPQQEPPPPAHRAENPRPLQVSIRLGEHAVQGEHKHRFLGSEE